MLELNRVHTWDEIATAYQNQWVIVTNIKEHNGEVESCKLLHVCTKETKNEYIKKYLDTDIKFACLRTTFNAPNIGYIS